MSKIEPLPATVQSAAVRACRDALHWRDDLRAVFLTAGVPPSLYGSLCIFMLKKIASSNFTEIARG